MDIDEITADDLAGEYPVLRYWPPDAAYSIDIIARLGTTFDFDDIEWHRVAVEDHPSRSRRPRCSTA